MSLFSPVVLTSANGTELQLRNRAFVAPMCQYSVDAEDGTPTPFHLVHLGSFATGGFSLVTVEATAVEARGRISPRDVGLWSDDQVGAHVAIVDFLHAHGAAAGIQLAHAGGKASTWPSLPGFTPGSVPASDGGWTSVAPTDAPILGLEAPVALSAADIADVVQAFADAAVRADAAGYDTIQLHAAHGYLIHEFLSPLSNTRTDSYGGSITGRARFLREVLAAITEVWPADKPIGIRFSATDWVESGLEVAEVAALARELVDEFGVAWFDVSSGGLTDGKTIPVSPGYQVSLAAAVTAAVEGTPAVVSAVGLIDDADQAQTVIASGQAHAVSIGRAALRNPHWAAVAASHLGVVRDENPIADQYWRGLRR